MHRNPKTPEESAIGSLVMAAFLLVWLAIWPFYALARSFRHRLSGAA